MKLPAYILLEKFLDELGIRDWRVEVKFCKGRKWRFDYAKWPLAIDVDGAIWVKSGHSTGKGIQNGYDKANEARILKWDFFRFSTDDVLTGKAKEVIRRWLESRDEL